MEGRELGPDITALLLRITNLCLMWQLAAAVAAAAAGTEDAAALNVYLQQRTTFVKVLESLLDSGATERLVTPEQLLSAQWWHLNDRHNSQVPAELAEQLSVGIHTLQDLAFLLLTELLWLENGNAALQQGLAAAAGGSRRGAAGAGFGQMALSSGVLDRLWRYCCGVLEREAPEVPETVGGGGEGDEIDEDPDDVFDDYDAEGGRSTSGGRGCHAFGGRGRVSEAASC
jgi:hypothetical protein